MHRIFSIASTIFFTIYSFALLATPAETSRYIIIDHFGYRPGDTKIAVIADPQTGFNANDAFTPGSTYEVRKWENDEVVASGAPKAWKNGATHPQSGDKGWWFDFSEVDAIGQYYIFDKENNVGSYQFEIREDVYFKVLQAALKMYYYNRCGCAKEVPFADERWVDTPAFLGPRQDTEARDLTDKNNADLAKDMSGGWFDAGDFNKYVTFAESVIHQLLDAYTQNTAAWSDNFNLPESGNGLPDIIDEIIWELDWLKKMQDPETGGVHIKMGSITYTTGSPPSRDQAYRYYGPLCSSSSIATAGMFAHAAIVLGDFPTFTAYADDLKNRSIMAWNWYHSHPKSENCDTQEIKSGDADRSLNDQNQMAVTAAVYLFALTGEDEYNDYVVDNHRCVENLNWWGPYRMARGDALLYYSQLPNGDSATRNSIISRKISNANSMSDFYKQFDNNDLYRAQMPDAQYHWGSNCVKANMGNINYDLIYYNLDPNNEELYLDKALSCIHYLHGVNPLNMVYLSNMYDYGAENSANEVYHGWFQNGTRYDNALTSPNGPAPGYVSGGPNKAYSGNRPNIKDQPPQKAYQDWNGSENSWEITEPAIYYQSAYLKLLSKFVDATTAAVDNPASGKQILAYAVSVSQNYPNPFNFATEIKYTVHRASEIRIEIFNVSGKMLTTLVDQIHATGDYSIQWHPEDGRGRMVSSGLYFYRMTAKPLSGNTSPIIAVNKMLYLK